MNDKLKLIIFGLGGMVGSFLLILLIFWIPFLPWKLIDMLLRGAVDLVCPHCGFSAPASDPRRR